MKSYWLIKSEPGSYGIGNLKHDKKTAWTGIRNFQARNYMQKDMRVGDMVLFYHSNTKEPGIYGIARVVSAAYPDPTQFDHEGNYFEKRATKEKPVWYLVDIEHVETLRNPVSLRKLREDSGTQTMMALRPGNRISITSVTKTEFDRVLALGS